MREYLLVFLVAAGTTYLLVGLSGRLAHLIGAVPPTRDRDVHREPVPRLGGLAMLVGLVAAFLVASQLPHMGRVFAESSAPRGVIIAAAAICLVGAADDIWGLSALMKFAGQLVAAGLLLVEGVQLFWLPLPSGTPFVLDSTQGALLTVLLVVGTANAVNFVDGLDGLAAGVVGTGAAAFFAYAYVLTVEQGFTRLTMPALLTAVLCGVCIGFLPHNMHPARIFMGDSGALLIGLLLAAGTITLTGQFPSPDVQDDGGTFLLALLPLVIPVAVIALPFADLVLAVWRRTGAGRSPFSPDKQHLHHRLLEIGHSHRRAVFIMWVWAGLVAFGIVVTALFGGWHIYLGFGIALVTTILITIGRPQTLLGYSRR
ncbi:MAG TPA: MraY family glycosyltransferase [Jiangellaceae bacterium]|nr:MraY family glycosyltransferase [Jiangellaceae bacterium]